MADTYLLPKAVNTETRQTVKEQDLTGGRFTHKQRAFAEAAAQRLANNMTLRTGVQWNPMVIEYTPTYRRS